MVGHLSIIGRSCVVHLYADDMGEGGHSDSLTTGHAGPRIGCGTVGLSHSFPSSSWFIFNFWFYFKVII